MKTIAIAPLMLLGGLLASAPAHAQVAIKKAGDHIAITIDKKPFTNFYNGAAYPKPFLWPLRTADGAVVTRNFPMAEVAGESHDHPHHRGLFIGYGEINGTNFWENERTYKTTNRGNMVVKKIEEMKSGKHKGTLKALIEWRDTGNTELMDEIQTMTFHADPAPRTIDFDLLFTAKTTLHWADTKEGFFAIRLADSMDEKHGGRMLNSEGATGEKNVWGKPATWVDYSGQVDGKEVGVLIFAHPGDPRYPPRWHSRAYGLFAVNPWAYRQFTGDKTSTAGGLTMKPGETLHVRYRVILHDGAWPASKIASTYSEYVEQAK